MADSPKELRGKVRKLHDEAEREAAEAEKAEDAGQTRAADAHWAEADRLNDEANELADEYSDLTGRGIHTDGTFAPATSHSFEPTDREVLEGAGVQTDDLTVAELAEKAAAIRADQAVDLQAQEDAAIRDMVGEVLGLDVSRLSDEELQRLVAENQEKFDQNFVRQHDLPEHGGAGLDGSAGGSGELDALLELAGREIPTRVPEDLAAKVTPLDSRATFGPEAPDGSGSGFGGGPGGPFGPSPQPPPDSGGGGGGGKDAPDQPQPDQPRPDQPEQPDQPVPDEPVPDEPDAVTPDGGGGEQPGAEQPAAAGGDPDEPEEPHMRRVTVERTDGSTQTGFVDENGDVWDEDGNPIEDYDSLEFEFDTETDPDADDGAGTDGGADSAEVQPVEGGGEHIDFTAGEPRGDHGDGTTAIIDADTRGAAESDDDTAQGDSGISSTPDPDAAPAPTAAELKAAMARFEARRGHDTDPLPDGAGDDDPGRRDHTEIEPTQPVDDIDRPAGDDDPGIDFGSSHGAGVIDPTPTGAGEIAFGTGEPGTPQHAVSRLDSFGSGVDDEVSEVALKGVDAPHLGDAAVGDGADEALPPAALHGHADLGPDLGAFDVGSLHSSPLESHDLQHGSDAPEIDVDLDEPVGRGGAADDGLDVDG